MSSKHRRAAVDRGKEAGEDDLVVDRKMIETIREATGATEEDIRVMLFECNYDANETTSRLIDNPFSQVQSKKDKKKKRDEDKKKEPAAKIVEVRRSTSTGGRGRGHDRERGPRGERGGDRTTDRGGSRGPAWGHDPSASAPVTVPDKQPTVSEESSGTGNWDLASGTGNLASGTGNLASGTGNLASGTGNWDLAALKEVESQVDQPTSSPGWGEIGSRAPGQHSAPQPIAQRSQPAPIRPPGGGSSGKSMADLFKQRPAAQPAANHQQPAPAATMSPYGSKPEERSEPNGWGSSHVNDLETTRQGGSLGGVAISAPQKSQGSQQLPIQAGSSVSAPPGMPTPVGSLSNVPASPGRPSLDEQVSVPSSTGLGGVAVEPPPRQAYVPSEGGGHSQSSWMPKAPALAASQQQPTLGSSILSSLSAASTPLEPPEAASPRSHHHQQDLGALAGSAFGNAQPPVILPPSAQQGANDIGTLNFQFGNFGLGSASPDLTAFSSAGFASAFEPAAASLPEASQASSGVSASEPYKAAGNSQPQSAYSQPQSAYSQPQGDYSQPQSGYSQPQSGYSQPQSGYSQPQSGYSQPQSGLAQAQTKAAQQAQQQQQQQQQQQRSYSAFTAASMQNPPQRPSIAPSSTAPEVSTAASQGLYGNQGYLNYAGQGYSQYQATPAVQQPQVHQQPHLQQQPFQSYGYQVPDTVEQAAAAAASQQAPAAAPKRSAAYDANSYANYGQAAGVKDFQSSAAKYGGAAGNAPAAAAHLGAAAVNMAGVSAGPTAGPAAAAVAAQTPISQMSGYGAAGQAGIGGVPQSAYYNAQQYSQYPQTSNYYHPGNSYGYGQNAAAAAAYQQGTGYGTGNSSYGGQGNKYAGGYGATGGGYQQHAGAAAGYSGQAHKQDKEAHLGAGHNMYAQPQLPLAGQQHYQGGGAGLRDHSNYGYQNPNQGYSAGGYGVGGRQYNQQYYGREQ